MVDVRQAASFLLIAFLLRVHISHRHVGVIFQKDLISPTSVCVERSHLHWQTSVSSSSMFSLFFLYFLFPLCGRRLRPLAAELIFETGPISRLPPLTSLLVVDWSVEWWVGDSIIEVYWQMS